MIGKAIVFLLRLGISLLIVAITTAILTLLPTFDVTNFWSLLIGVLLISLLNATIYPLLVRLTLPITVMTFGLVSLVLNGLIVLFAAYLLPGWTVTNLFTAILISIVYTIVLGTIIPGVMGRRDNNYYRYAMAKRFADQAKKDAAKSYDKPGLMIIEIDGLSEPVLRHAIRQGVMPFVTSWMRSGEYRLVRWDSGLPSQTSAMQAGILHGSHFNIPAFRFYDKQADRLLVSNHPKDAGDILKPSENGQGILVNNGFSLNNWAHGDAEEVLLTFSGFATDAGSMKKMRSSETMYQFFAVAANVQRVIFAALGDLIQEFREARAQRNSDLEPRIERKMPYPLVRAGTVAVFPYLSIYLLIGKMWEGISIAYTTFVSYDEVAHHAGIERPDAFRILGQLDDQIKLMVEASKETPRKYDFVILSDHGQSQGATFRQRYGLTLAQLIDNTIADPGHAIQTVLGEDASGNVNLLATQFAQSSHWASRRVAELTRSRQQDGVVQLVPDDPNENKEAQQADTVVCASGNLALVYFKKMKERMLLEDIDAAYPGLIDVLTDHPGVGFVLVRSKEDGLLAVGRSGVYHLDDDTIDGLNPLAPFGPHAPMHLRELDTYPNVGDLVINSFYDEEWDEVAAFEELVGSHGGLGGHQNQPFILFPSAFDPNGEVKDLIGAPSIYKLIKGWAEGR